MVDMESALQWSRLGSRKTFGMELTRLASEHPELMVLVADVASSSGLAEFAKKYPDQFLNVGIAEQNMFGVAAGLSKNGYKVFAVSFAPFASMRGYEMIRSYLGYMELDVTVVGIGSGLGLGVVGNTHYGLEEISLMNSIPGMTILSPADCTETVKTVRALMERKGPAYLRLTGVEGNPAVYKEDYEFRIGQSVLNKEGTDLAILATGTMVYEAIRTAKLLEKQGISASVHDVHTLKPMDGELVCDLAEKGIPIVTLEEHTLKGGLGSIVASINVQQKTPVHQIMFGLPDRFMKAGDYRYVLGQAGLNAKEMAAKIAREVKSK